jgi:nitrogen fixation protein NifU and related proteins
MKTPSLYSEEVMKHFRNPKNVGVLKDADGKGRIGNMQCGDIMELYIKVKNGKIADVKFQTFGCVVALAVSSILTEMVKGKTIEQAMNLTNKDILDRAGKVPALKIHCSVLAADALKEAIYDYLLRGGKKIPGSLQKDHERIAGNLHDVEEKHKDFAEFEEKMLDKKPPSKK